MLYKRLGVVVVLVLLLVAMDAMGKESKEELVPGIIINTPDIMMDLEAYQGGIGFKLHGLEPIKPFVFDLRTMLGFEFADWLNDFRIDVGAALEFHFFYMNRISPYWGFFVNTGFKRVITPAPPASNESRTVPISFGGLLGAEVFLFDFLSVFAEYNLAVNFTNTYYSATGSEPISEWDSGFKSGLGNNACIGINIYFKPVTNLE